MYLDQSTLRHQGQNRAFEAGTCKNQEFQYHFSSVDWPKYIIFLSKYISKNIPNIYRHSPKIVKIINNIRHEHTYKIY